MSIFLPKSVVISGLVFLGIAAISIFWASYPLLAIYQVTSVILLAIFAFLLAVLIIKKNIARNFILKIIALLGVFESALALIQFYLQKSVGFYFFGEPQIGVAMTGVAKVLIGGAPLLRAYGTFPHPNVLGGFLFVCLGGIYCLWQEERRFGGRVIYALSILFTLLGLVLTFSRSAWLVAAALTFLFFIYLFKKNRKKLIEFTTIIAGVIFFLWLVLGWAILPRAGFSFGEPAVAQRIDYTKMSLDIIKSAPFGVGAGNQVLFAIDGGFYQKAGMKEIWQWQPIHNIFLLILTELGIIGLISFGIFLFSVFRSAGFNLISGIFAGLLIIGLFDHYLWTLLPGRLMFWLVVGLMMGSSPHSSKDRAQASEA